MLKANFTAKHVIFIAGSVTDYRLHYGSQIRLTGVLSN
jgi:hypothetical protein